MYLLPVEVVDCEAERFQAVLEFPNGNKIDQQPEFIYQTTRSHS